VILETMTRLPTGNMFSDAIIMQLNSNGDLKIAR
jgi:hypothetical protein